MGYYFVIGQCVNCGNVFTFNPDKVPSVTVNGRREPVCQACIEFANPIREARGLPRIKPLPGAYDPAPEYPEEMN